MNKARFSEHPSDGNTGRFALSVGLVCSGREGRTPFPNLDFRPNVATALTFFLLPPGLFGVLRTTTGGTRGDNGFPSMDRGAARRRLAGSGTSGINQGPNHTCFVDQAP